MSNRNPLTDRRRHEAFNLKLNGMPPVTVGLGYYDDDGLGEEKRLGEVFITAGKVGSQFEIECGDGAVLISLALQHGISVAQLYHSMARTPEGKPASVVGHILFEILQEQSGEPVTDVPSDQGDGDIKTRGVEGQRTDREDNNGAPA